MVDNQLRPQGVSDPAVLQAMATVPREQFLPDQSRPLAYVDRAIAIGPGRFLSAPAVLGQLLTQMAPERGQRALVIGAGTGYSAALLAAMGLEVVAVESAPELAGKARELGVAVIEAPLEAGHRAGAPYDQILIDGAVEAIPDAIIAQLADGGRLGTALSRPRRHAPDCRPQVGRRVRLSFDRRCGGSGAAGLHPRESFHFLGGVGVS